MLKKIIFFNDKKLAENLKDKKVGNKEKLFYCLFFVIGSQLLGLMLFKIPMVIKYGKENCLYSCNEKVFYSAFILIPVISLLIKGYGIILSYKIDRKDFIERLICLLFPVTIRMSILMMAIKFLISLTKGLVESLNLIFIGNPIVFVDKLCPIIIAIYFCLRLIKAFKIVSSNN